MKRPVEFILKGPDTWWRHHDVTVRNPLYLKKLINFVAALLVPL